MAMPIEPTTFNGPDGRQCRHQPIVILPPSAPIVGTGQQDFFFGDAALARFTVDVTALQGPSPSLAITTYGSDDGVTWTQIQAFGAITALGSSRRYSPIDKYFRIGWAVTGASRLGAVTAGGGDATPQSVTLSGTPTSPLADTLSIAITSTGSRTAAVFSWTLNGVTTTGVAMAATVALGGSGITAAFPTGTYTAGDTYTAPIAAAPGVSFGVNGGAV